MTAPQPDRLDARDHAADRLTTRDRQRLETRERIYRASLDEFRRVGASSAQIDAITRAAGVARGTFYVHFSSKEDVLRELRGRIEDRIRDRLAANDLSAVGLRRLLGLLCAAVLDEDEDPSLVREVMAQAVRAPGDGGDGDPGAGWADAAYLRPVTAELQRLQAEGALRADCEPREVATIFMTSLFGFLTAPGRPPRERRASISRLLDFFLNGVAAGTFLNGVTDTPGDTA